jgi:predicted phage terminase large subunit-like protein
VLYREKIFPIAYNPGRASKLQRLHAVSHLFHAGLFYVVESKKRPNEAVSWADELINQLCSFQGEGSIKHDDYVDAITQALRWMADNARISVTEEDDDDHHKPPITVINPYAV